MIEDRVIGPLYKTTISKKTYSSLWNPTGAYAVSVSKANQLLSLYLFLIWVAIAVHFVRENIAHFRDLELFYVLVGAITISMIVYLAIGTKTGEHDTVVHFDRRSVVDKGARDADT